MSHKFSDDSQFGLVSTFSELVNTNFQGETNAICWHRVLDGDFREIVSKLQLIQPVTVVDPELLLALQLSNKGCIARDLILNDLLLLTDVGASPSLNLIKCYARDEELDFISTDVYSYHVDRSPIATDTFLCTYYGAVGDFLPNSHAEQLILIPEIREKLKQMYEVSETDFDYFSTEHFFDLHYRPKHGSSAINLGLGHLWKLAVDHPGQKVSPCVHRAPIENEGENRLLLIC